MANKVQCYASKFIEKRNRTCQFWFNAKQQDDGQWLVHMNADFVASVDCLTNDPTLLFASMVDEWEKEIS